MTQSSQLIWHDSDWQQQAHTWIREQAGRNALQLTGALEQNHAYAWSTVMRVPTDQGTVFFKATAPETVYEIALTQKLAQWLPNCMPDLVAVDLERGWMLMRDGGEQLRAAIRPSQDIKPWEPVITSYADIQMQLAKHINEILALGIPDHRPAVLPVLYAELLADEASLMLNQEKGLSESDYQELKDLSARFKQICVDLIAVGIPDSIDHGDFHDGNVLLKNGRITFFDWGDASVTHPFTSLRTFFVSIEISLKLDDYAFTPEMSQLLDRYLERWQGYGSKEALLSAYRLSKPAAAIVKALTWRRTILRLEDALRPEYAWIVPEMLREFLYYEKQLAK